MLNGFEKQTEPLNDYERDVLLPIIVQGLKIRVGARRAITNRKMTTNLTNKGYKVSDGRVRKIINHIRCCGYVKCLVATSKGYYVATSPAEMESYITSLGGREGAIRAVREAMECQLDEWRTIINQNSHHHNV